MTQTRATLFVILFIIAGFSGWLYVHYDTTHTKQTTLTDEYPNSFAEKISITYYDEQGKIKLKMTSPKLTHHPLHNTSFFDTPHVVLYQQDEKPWVIDAEHGKSENDNQIITFWGKVRLIQQGGKNNKKTTIETESLSYLPQKQLAETEHKILLQQPGVRVSAVGLRAQLDKKQFQLLSQARAHYANMD